MWYFGDGQTSTAWEPLHQYANFGTYSVMLVTHNTTSGCSDTMIKQVDIISPTANVTASQTLFCPETTVTFTGSLSGGTATNYFWIITGAANAGANTFTLPTYTYTFHNAGHYNVLLIVTDQNNCQDSVLKSNYILADKPIPGFSASPTIGCTPLTVLFTDTSTSLSGAKITNRVWDFGNGTAATTNKTISHTYPLQGDYSVSLKVTDSLGCVDSLVKPLYIHASKPSASFVTTSFGCAEAYVPFSNGSQRASKYFWDFGDGDTSTVFQPSHVYTASGKYTITLVATDTLGCKDTFKMTQGLDVYKATASFTMSDSIAVCPPLSVHLINTSPSGQTFLWNYGNGGKSNVYSPYVLYSSHGDFIVKLIATEIHGCKDTATGHIKILGFNGGFSYAPLSGCVPLTVSYYDTLSGIPNAVWDFNDGYTQLINGPTATHTYTIPGTFIPRIIFTNGKGCTSFNNGTDEIHVDAAEAGFTWGPACEYQDIFFHDTSKSYFSSIITRWWVFDDGLTDVVPNPKHHYGPPGSYPVQLSVLNGNGCKDTIVKMVDVHALPLISAGPDTIICLHDSATLTPGGGVSYVWSPISYLDCSTCTNPHAGPPIKFSYIVTGTDINGCMNQDTVTISVKNKVVATIGPGGEICDNESVQLEVSGARSYRWAPPDGLDNDTSAMPVASPHNTTNYTVIAYEGSCIPDTGSAKVIIHPLPKVTARGEQTIIAGSTADIQASGERIVRYEWSPAGTLSCVNCPAPTSKPSQTTTYTIKVYSDFGCMDSDNVTIHVLCDKSQLFIPNTFTPNGDGQNDVFYPRGTGLTTVKSFRIYNRWGEKIFERSGFNLNDESYGWNGEFKGQVIKPDVFVYIIEVYCDNGEVLSFKGDVTIIR